MAEGPMVKLSKDDFLCTTKMPIRGNDEYMAFLERRIKNLEDKLYEFYLEQ